MAIGGGFGGWSLYAKDGLLKYCYNWLGLCRYCTEATLPLPAGQHQVRMEFAYDGGGLGKGGTTVAEDYTAETSKFSGRINWVQLDQGLDDYDHLITPEERLRVAMARQ